MELLNIVILASACFVISHSSTPVPGYAIVLDKDCGGYDITSPKGDLQTCASGCSANTACMGFLHRTSDSGCWLKRSCLTAGNYPGLYQYHKVIDVPGYTVTPNVDCSSNTISSGSTTSLSACAQSCSVLSDCEAFVYKPNMCWRKSQCDATTLAVGHFKYARVKVMLRNTPRKENMTCYMSAVLLICGLTFAWSKNQLPNEMSPTDCVTREELHFELSQLKDEINQMKQELNDKQQNENFIGFTAYHGSSGAVYLVYSVGETVQFPEVVTNLGPEGSTYNPSTGIFHCGVPGIYYFTYSFLSDGSDNDEHASLALTLGGAEIVWGHGQHTSGDNTGSNAAIVQCNNEDVYIKAVFETSYVFCCKYTSFTGYLLAIL